MAEYPYNKRIKDERGVYIRVYGKTKEELDAKVKARLAEIEYLKQLQLSPTVSMLAAQWIVTLPPSLSASRREDIDTALRLHVLNHIGDMHCIEVTDDTIARLMVSESKLSRSMQDKLVFVLRSMFLFAKRRGIIDYNPCDTIKAGGKKPAEKIALTDAQKKTLIEAVRDTRAWGFVMLGLYAGLRREEILALKWDCVELEDSAPHIKVRRAMRWEHNRPVVSEQLKSSKARRDIPLPPKLLACLQELKAASKSDYVVPDIDGNPCSQVAAKNLWSLVRRRQTGDYAAKQKSKDADAEGLTDSQKARVLKDKPPDPEARSKNAKSQNHKMSYTVDFSVTPHILRHTYASDLILAGVPVKTVQYLMGHEKAETTLNIYSHLMENRPADLINVVSNALK